MGQGRHVEALKKLDELQQIIKQALGETAPVVSNIANIVLTAPTSVRRDRDPVQHSVNGPPLEGGLQAVPRLAEEGRALHREQRPSQGHNLQQLRLPLPQDQ